MLDIYKVAKILDTSPTTVRRILRDGELPSFRVGALWRIKEEDLEAYMDTSPYTPKPKTNLNNESETRNEQH
jgi:excisionase family DNA binding protein